jgi:hypothetical protein
MLMTGSLGMIPPAGAVDAAADRLARLVLGRAAALAVARGGDRLHVPHIRPSSKDGFGDSAWIFVIGRPSACPPGRHYGGMIAIQSQGCQGWSMSPVRCRRQRRAGCSGSTGVLGLCRAGVIAAPLARVGRPSTDRAAFGRRRSGCALVLGRAGHELGRVLLSARSQRCRSRRLGSFPARLAGRALSAYN